MSERRSCLTQSQLGLTPIHCATTLLFASLRPLPSVLPSIPPSPSPVLQHAVLHLLPPLITHIAESIIVSTTSPASGSNGTNEIIKGLVQWCSGLPDQFKSRGYSVLLPTLCLLLDPPEMDTPSSPSTLHNIATTTLLSLAQGGPGAFRDATILMAQEERGRMERAIREAASSGAQKGAAAVGGEKRGIELRSFG